MKNKTATKNILVLISLIFLTFVISSCHHTDEPIPPPPEGKRDYQWTMDTLSYPGSLQTLMRAVWASSAKNVYVVGPNDRNRGQMYRFDGAKWSDVHLAQSDGGNITGAFDLYGIYGFSQNDIYAIGSKSYSNLSPPPNFLDSSMILRYDGVEWREETITRGSRLSVVWGIGSSDVWAGGEHGTLFHFDGSRWARTNFDTLFLFDSFAGFTHANQYAVCGKYVDFVAPFLDSLQFFLMNYNGEIWTPVDSFMSTLSQPAWKFGIKLWSSNTTLYSATYGVYQWLGNGWELLLENDWPMRCKGSADYNIFGVGDLGRIFHWNGKNWKRLTEIEHPDIIWWDVWTNNVETFIVGNDGRQTYILHGK
jgi:hypothetical protein